ncbi:hypothetical protein [Bradyrhizobium sp. LTSP885]|uniref:hypothetical protein n=1 Tax=Bradyrhizobium sp. LTSP885 TaxID=1619232 RepID=UPI0009E5B8ED|nr:hypothetical protein [Bradyrhizobium sp. LTSP885]
MYVGIGHKETSQAWLDNKRGRQLRESLGAIRISWMSKFGRRFLQVLLALCIANIISIFIVALAIVGGDALKGGVIDGHYYVGHLGKLVEVSEATYTYARLHEMTLFLTVPLAVLARGILRRG